MPNNETFITKPIKDLEGLNFFVDDYQRGYKWTVQQVLDLLNDIDSFAKNPEEFYCLQPLVVKERDDDKTINLFSNTSPDSKIYEVIDGQQRLTTIYIILKIIQDETLYNIRYETREASAEFLENIKNNLSKIEFKENNEEKLTIEINKSWKAFIDAEEHEKYDNIDNYHFFTAFFTIKNWFSIHNKKGAFLNTLLDNTRFIWYKDTYHSNAKETFRNLNSGKTELTNSELIKALFVNKLKNDNKEIQQLKQTEFASEWDQIEQQLADDSFWFFISNETDKNKYPTRIDYLFEILLGKPKSKTDRLYTYRQYASGAKDLNWDEIKNLFYKLKDWFEDREVYHLMGFILTRNLGKNGIKEIKEKSGKNNGKENFKNELKNIITKEFNKSSQEEKVYDLNSLNYQDNYNEILNLLLLHNIETYRRSEAGFRFPFRHFKQKKWSLEHIHAQNPRDFKEVSAVYAWLEDIEQMLNGGWETEEYDSIKKEIDHLRDSLKENPTELSPEIQGQISSIKEKTDEIFRTHHISNLALLDKDTNSSFGNNNFKEKRTKALEIDQQEWTADNKAFIPICTKNAFLKYYSSEIKQLEFWSSNDRRDYLNNIKETLKSYLPKEKKNHA